MATILRQKTLDRSVLDLATERLHHAFDLFDTISVSFSGGKDSTICLELALEVARQRGKLPLRVFFHDEEAIPLQTETYLQILANRPEIALEWYCLPVKHRNACSRLSPWWSPWDPAAADLWVRPVPPLGRTSLPGFRTTGDPRDRLTIPETNGLLHPPDRCGNVGIIMGIRGQESMIRRRAVLHRTEENYLVHLPTGSGTSRGNLWKVYPIYDWQTEDVWTACRSFGWTYNTAYDVMTMAGMPLQAQRCSPAYGEEPMYGFYRFKTCFPEVWDKMSQRVPGANTALLYARTELYGFGSMPDKPPDMSWQDFIVFYLAQFPSQERVAVASALKKAIRGHYRKAHGEPILATVRHPDTGVCWQALLNLALRGDLKGRRAATMLTKVPSYNDPRYAEARQRYDRARAQEGV